VAAASRPDAPTMTTESFGLALRIRSASSQVEGAPQVAKILWLQRLFGVGVRFTFDPSTLAAGSPKDHDESNRRSHSLPS
jgi:hypothetical protein